MGASNAAGNSGHHRCGKRWWLLQHVARVGFSRLSRVFNLLLLDRDSVKAPSALRSNEGSTPLLLSTAAFISSQEYSLSWF